MKSGLRPYDEMKSSHQDWLNEVPIHWNLVKSKRLFRETSIKNHPDEELLSATQNKGVVPRHMLDTRVVMPMGNFESFKLVKEGNFVISLRSFQGGLEYSKYRGIVSPAYNVIEETTGQNRMYYKYLFKSKTFISELQRNVTGIRQGKNIDVKDFKEIVLPVPEREEQDQIVKYLDYKLAKINKFIKAKKKLIAILKEQKLAIINQAVTKGLDPDVKMKPSGIEWLGDVPEHWETCKLKNLGYFKSGTNLTSLQIEDNGEFPVYGGNGLRGYYDKYTHDGEYILIGRQGALCGNVHLIAGKFWPTEHAVVVTINKNVDILWLSFMLQAMNLNQYSQSAAQPGLAVENIKNLRTILPEFNHQIEIGLYIDKKIKAIDLSINKILNEIQLVNEYNNSLISNVVTGRVDVRQIIIEEMDQENVDEVDRDIEDEYEEEIDEVFIDEGGDE